MNKPAKSLILLMLIFITGFLSVVPIADLYAHAQLEKSEAFPDRDVFPEMSNGEKKDVIVFFNQSSYNSFVKTRFEYYGGILKTSNDWNNVFNSISGFAGNIPIVNISDFRDEFPGINIENDEIVETQMNYVAVQTNNVNSTWYTNGFKGDTNSSVAVIDTGVEPNNSFLVDKVIAWEDFIGSNPVTDENGHGTFMSSIITGTGKDPYDSINPSAVHLRNEYSHLERFGLDPASRNYSIKLFTLNVSKPNTNIELNASWDSLDPGIDGFWFEFRFNNSLANSTGNIGSGIQSSIIQHISQNDLGIYDLYLKYHRITNMFPSFSFSVNVSFFPEKYVPNFNHFTGIANDTKIVSYKALNQTGKGYASDIISALASALLNASIYHISCVCLSIASFGENATAFSLAVDDLIEAGIAVIIAAGNNGIRGSETTLSKLAQNNNALIVGAINDVDQVSSYSSAGNSLDIVAPGGSKLSEHRTIVSGDARSNQMTSLYGTSIATAVVSAVINVLIEAAWGSWNTWINQDPLKRVNYLKSRLLMTASETNLNREDDPETTIDESLYSPSRFNGLSSSLKDRHEGYGRLNVQSAVDSLIKKIYVNQTINGSLESSAHEPLSQHVFARQIELIANKQYLFNLSEVENDADFDFFLFSNESSSSGEPILLQSSRKWYGNFETFYFTPKHNQTNCILIVKAVEGNSNFTLNVSMVDNIYEPELFVPEINFAGKSKNTTVIGLQEFQGYEPAKNYSIDVYRFYIDYYDNDSSNVPPQEVLVHIVELARNYSMFQVNQFDTNYTNGATFQTNWIELKTPRIYHYYFIASDGKHVTWFPELGELNITIEFPTDSEQFPYYHSFNSGLGNWFYNGTGWGILNQTNTNDDRSRLHETEWASAYFGREHNYSTIYTYQPFSLTDPFLNGSLTSPLINLTQIASNFTQPFLSIGIRTSINAGDYIYLQVNLNWTGWSTIRTFTNEEQDWYMEYINITDYIDYFVQFRFIATLDEDYDSVNYKGFMLDYFAITNYTNHDAPLIDFNINTDISSLIGSEFENFTFSCRYFDADGNYPEFVYLEINNGNFSMINIFGDWNSSTVNPDPLGIYFSKSIVLGELANKTFRFHVSDGRFTQTSSWYNEDDSLFMFINPDPLNFNINQNNKMIGYQFSTNNLTEFYVKGKPLQKDRTAWLKGDNTWHPIKRVEQDFLYGGMGQSFGGDFEGYGENWDAQLITRPINLQGEYRTYLNFYHEVSLQNEFFLDDDFDACRISITTDYGQNWNLLKEYFFDSEDLSGNESIELTQYNDETIMIKFSLFSNNVTAGIGQGWIISNVYIGYDESTDFIHPLIVFINPLEGSNLISSILIKVNISDNRELNPSEIYLYIDGMAVDRQSFDFDSETGLLRYQWDTTLYRDGNIQIKVIAFDREGNESEEVLNVTVENFIFNMRTWGPIILFIIGAVVLGILLYYYSERRGKHSRERKRNLNAEQVRLGYIDKDQIIKRIELIEAEDELQRPLTLHCKYCDSWFESDKDNYICPICEHDQIYVAYNCMNCGKWYFKDEPGENYYCKNNKCEGVRLVRREVSEVKDILGKKGILLRKYEQKGQKFSILD